MPKKSSPYKKKSQKKLKSPKSKHAKSKPRSKKSKRSTKRSVKRSTKKSVRRHNPHPGQYYVPAFSGVTGKKACVQAGGVPRRGYENLFGTPVKRSCAAPKGSGNLTQSPCYGMLKSGCATDPQCRWTKRYFNDNARLVKGHCGLIPGGQRGLVGGALGGARTPPQVFAAPAALAQPIGVPQYTMPPVPGNVAFKFF